MSRTYDVFVIGAGPAGALVALEARRLGASVCLVGSHKGPFRVESLTSSGQRLLASLGCGHVIAGATVTEVERMEMTWRKQPESRSLADDRPILVMRPRLERLLVETAIAAGADFLAAHIRDLTDEGMATLGSGETISARFVVDAAGRRAVFRPKPQKLGPTNAAIIFRGRTNPGPVTMTLNAEEDGWLWMAKLKSGDVHAVWICGPKTLAGLNREGRQRFLSERFPDLKPAPVSVAEAGLTTAGSAMDGRIVRIGDAALARDPISSQGLAWALGSAARASVVIATLLDSQGEHSAARAFVNRDHQDAVEVARAAISKAYAEQALHHHKAFWRERAVSPPALGIDTVGSMPTEERLRLNDDASLIKEAVLDGRRIRWQDALHLPFRGRSTAFIATCPAAALYRILATPGTLSELACRIEPLVPPVRAAEALQALWRDGVLIRCSGKKRDSTGPRKASSIEPSR